MYILHSMLVELPGQHCYANKGYYTHCKAAATGLHVGTELDVTTVKAVDVAVTVEVCFKNVGRTAFKMVLR